MNERTGGLAGVQAWRLRHYLPASAMVAIVALLNLAVLPIGGGGPRPVASGGGGGFVGAPGRGDAGPAPVGADPVADATAGSGAPGGGSDATTPFDAASTDSTAATAPTVRSRGAAQSATTSVTARTASAPTAAPCAADGRLAVTFPYRPPCAAPFHGDNGGATWKGVSATTVRVAYYLPQQDAQSAAAVASLGSSDQCSSDACTRQAVQDYARWFNERYERYGRKVELVPLAASGASTDDAAARADAVKAAEELKVFAVVNAPQPSSFCEELAARQVLCIWPFGIPYDFAERHSPYVWTYNAGSTVSYAQEAEWLGRRIAGRKARWAGSAALQVQPRKLGVIFYDTPNGDWRSGLSFFEERLRHYGAAVAKSVSYSFDLAQAQVQATNAISQLRAAGVTTVVLLTDPIYPIFLTGEATRQQWFPEWVIGYAGTNTDSLARMYDQQQMAHAFGMTENGVAVPDAKSYWWRMYQEVRPGQLPPTQSRMVLHALFPVFTGIHLAGPRLTAASFRDGLQRFPALAGTPTIPGGAWQPKTLDGGARIDDYGFFEGYHELWWDAGATGADGTKGAYRHVAGGRRLGLGDAPATEPPMFDPAGSVVSYPEER